MLINQVDWNILIAELGPALYRFFLAAFSHAQADDCVQETLIRLIDRINDGKFDSAKGNLRMYAFGIAHFVKLENDRVRQHAEYSEDDALAENVGVDEALVAEQSRRRLRRAIRQLSDQQQQVIGLYMDSELSFNEIAAILGMPAATVRSHLHRAKESLKTILEKTNEVRHE